MSATTARRPGVRAIVLALALAGLVAGCTTGAVERAEPLTTPTSTPRGSTAAPPGSSSAPPTPTTVPSPTASTPTDRPEPSGDRGPGPDGVTITAPPPGVEPVGPVVVLVHGGAWVGGSPALLDGWADALAAEGAVVFNASYALLAPPVGGYPSSVDDVACAVRFARAEAAAYTDSDELILVGHSAGAHLGAVVSLDPAPWGGDCAYPPAAPPDRLVGLAGIYDVKTISILLLVFTRFVGGTVTAEPERWAALNPVELAAGQDGLDVVLVTGAEDDLVPPSQAQAFLAALPNGAELVEVAAADHNDLQDPDVVGVKLILGK